jgi:hypothetical protein
MLVAITLLTLTPTGCSVVHNGYTAMTGNSSWDKTVVTLRNRSFSAKAWHRRKHHFCKEKYNSDFCNGFRAGYEAVASGSDGCTPAFPPSEYWSWEYQSGEGHGRTSAWFAGFPHGARAAEEDGVANWHQVPMSAGMQAQYQQTGMLTHEGALYPIPGPDSMGTGAIPGAGAPYSGVPYIPGQGETAYGVPMADGSYMPIEAFPEVNMEEILPNSGALPLQGPIPTVPQ